jgi:hypothetical protein
MNGPLPRASPPINGDPPLCFEAAKRVCRLSVFGFRDSRKVVHGEGDLTPLRRAQTPHAWLRHASSRGLFAEVAYAFVWAALSQPGAWSQRQPDKDWGGGCGVFPHSRELVKKVIKSLQRPLVMSMQRLIVKSMGRPFVMIPTNPLSDGLEAVAFDGLVNIAFDGATTDSYRSSPLP